jgi:O-antigen/teichoic acid export membrane protein
LATVSADFLLLILLIPRWGLLGAAFATSISTIAVTLWRTVQTRRLLRLSMVVPAHLAVLLSWALGLATGLGILAGTSHSVLSEVLALTGFALVFFGLIHGRAWVRRIAACQSPHPP